MSRKFRAPIICRRAAPPYYVQTVIELIKGIPNIFDIMAEAFDEEKEIRKIRKKLRQIENLERQHRELNDEEEDKVCDHISKSTNYVIMYTTIISIII